MNPGLGLSTRWFKSTFNWIDLNLTCLACRYIDGLLAASTAAEFRFRTQLDSDLASCEPAVEIFQAVWF
jgi:hypothetical protein